MELKSTEEWDVIMQMTEQDRCKKREMVKKIQIESKQYVKMRKIHY